MMLFVLRLIFVAMFTGLCALLAVIQYLIGHMVLASLYALMTVFAPFWAWMVVSTIYERAGKKR